MRKTRCLSVVALVAAVLASGAGTVVGVAPDSPAALATNAASPVRLVGARVCPYEALSKRRGYCARDSRAVAMRTNRITCSVTTVTNRPLTLRVRLRYDGSSVQGPDWSVRVPAGTRYHWFSYTVGAGVPLPAGSWDCTFTLGPAKVIVPFRTVGPSGDVVDLTICAGRNTIGPLKYGLCRIDETSTGLPYTESIACSALVLHKIGAIAKVEIVDPNGGVIGTAKDKITSALWAEWAWTISKRGGFLLPARTRAG